MFHNSGLQPYELTVKYRPGPQNVADSIAENAASRAVSIQEIEEVLAEMRKSQDCRNAPVHTNNWTICEADYKAVRNASTVLGKLVLWGTRLVIPRKLRKQVLDLAHEGHQGVEKNRGFELKCGGLA